MSKQISALFSTRDEAETVVEHLAQEHGLEPDSIEITPASTQNSAGEVDGQVQGAASLRVTARVSADDENAVRSTFAAYGGK